MIAKQRVMVDRRRCCAASEAVETFETQLKQATGHCLLIRDRERPEGLGNPRERQMTGRGRGKRVQCGYWMNEDVYAWSGVVVVVKKQGGDQALATDVKLKRLSPASQASSPARTRVETCRAMASHIMGGAACPDCLTILQLLTKLALRTFPASHADSSWPSLPEAKDGLLLRLVRPHPHSPSL